MLFYFLRFLIITNTAAAAHTALTPRRDAHSTRLLASPVATLALGLAVCMGRGVALGLGVGETDGMGDAEGEGDGDSTGLRLLHTAVNTLARSMATVSPGA